MKKVILVSLDALAGGEYELIRQLPGFSKLLARGACCPQEESVYPTLTYPCHASMVTGCTPGVHGIVNNHAFHPGARIPHWNFYATRLKKPALWDYANRAGKKTLSMSWPVSAGGAIRWSMPEMTPAKPKIWNADSFLKQLWVFAKYGTPLFAIRTLLGRRGLPKAWFLGRQPQLDECMLAAFLQALERYPFDIALLHVYGMDDAKHQHGTDSPQAHAFLKKSDAFVEKLLEYADAQREKGNSVLLLITGDHSQRNAHSMIHGNFLLEQMGLCKVENGKLVSWKACVDSGDGMAYVYLNHIQEGQEKAQLLARIRERFLSHPGVAAVLEPEEFIPLGCDPAAALVLEGADGYGFAKGAPAPGNEPDGDGVSHDAPRALHGYLPSRGDYRTMLLACGDGVRHGTIPRMSIMDLLPTICKWMDIPLDEHVQGRVVEELFCEP